MHSFLAKTAAFVVSISVSHCAAEIRPLDPGSDAGTATLNADEFCEAFVHTAAETAATCIGGDAIYWRAVQEYHCDQQLKCFEVSTHWPFDAEAAMACLAEIRKTPCHAFGGIGFDTRLAVCNRVFRIPAGRTCSRYFDVCEAGFYCLGEPDAKCIAANAIVEAGGACSGSIACSAPGGCVRGVCTGQPSVGDPCEVVTQCPPAAYCAVDVCEPFRLENESCERTSFSDNCSPGGLECMARSGMCERLGRLGDRCEDSNGCIGTPCVNGRCELARLPGEPCEDNSSECIAGSDCRDGICVERGKGIGQECLDHSDCARRLECDNGRCRHLLSPGDVYSCQQN